MIFLSLGALWHVICMSCSWSHTAGLTTVFSSINHTSHTSSMLGPNFKDDWNVGSHVQSLHVRKGGESGSPRVWAGKPSLYAHVKRVSKCVASLSAATSLSSPRWIPRSGRDLHSRFSVWNFACRFSLCGASWGAAAKMRAATFTNLPRVSACRVFIFESTVF